MEILFDQYVTGNGNLSDDSSSIKIKINDNNVTIFYNMIAYTFKVVHVEYNTILFFHQTE